MKKTVWCLVLSMLLGVLLPCLPVAATDYVAPDSNTGIILPFRDDYRLEEHLPDYDDVWVEGPFYYVTDWNGVDGATLIAYVGNALQIVIPETLGGKPVRRINDCAFSPHLADALGGYNTDILRNIQSIYVPDTVKTIGYCAFESCESMENLRLPEQMDFIEKYAFAFCSSLRELHFPAGIPGIEYGTCGLCHSLESVTFPAGIRYIDACAFGATALQEVTVPDGVKEIGYRAFQECASLQRVLLPEGLTHVGDMAFFDDNQLRFYGTAKSTAGSLAADYGRPYTEAPSFARVSVTLTSNFQLNFKVKASDLQGFSSVYAEFTMGNRTETVTAYATEGDYCVFRFHDIAPDSIDKTVTARLCGVVNGCELWGDKLSYSILQYCRGILRGDYPQQLKTLIVDMLNYCTESQLYVNVYDTLANSWLTPEQQAYASGDRALESVKNVRYKTVSDPEVTWKGVGLYLADAVRIRVTLYAPDTTDLRIVYTGETLGLGTCETTTFYPLDSDYYCVYLDTLGADQMSESVYITAYRGDKPVSHTVRYSIETYAALTADDPLIGTLVKAMMRYGDSARAYALSLAQPSVPEGFRLSGLDDVTDASGSRTYTVYAPYTDTYTLTGTGVSRLTLTENGKTVADGKTSLSVALTEGKTYVLTVKTATANASFQVETKANQHNVTLPYDVGTPAGTAQYNVYGSTPLTAATVDYQKRAGGTYIYSNNPEMFSAKHVGQAFMRNEGLTGEVYVTFEHSNASGRDVYLGYQLKNTTDHDVYVTVTNIGYQWEGTWFGQLAWYDFYNTAFRLPENYFQADGSISDAYASFDYSYRDYTPRVFQPVTYRLPAGETFWVIGGTSADAYRQVNVDGTADHKLIRGRCANGNVKFTVYGGEVTGTMYCYDSASQVKAEPAALGYVADGYAAQYSGSADHHGVIDNSMAWTFGDSDKAQVLPVTYVNRYADKLPTEKVPYAAYNSVAHTTTGTTWMTHLNPQNSHKAVGTDMVEFHWHDQAGNPIVIDNDHADGSGEPANTGNWMIEYQDHFTFVNQGNTDRVIKLHLRDHGTLALLVRDSRTGEVLETAYTVGLSASSSAFSNCVYTLTVPAHSVSQVTLDYLLVACSYGNVTHAVELC